MNNLRKHIALVALMSGIQVSIGNMGAQRSIGEKFDPEIELKPGHGRPKTAKSKKKITDYDRAKMEKAEIKRQKRREKRIANSR